MKWLSGCFDGYVHKLIKNKTEKVDQILHSFIMPLMNSDDRCSVLMSNPHIWKTELMKLPSLRRHRSHRNIFVYIKTIRENTRLQLEQRSDWPYFKTPVWACTVFK